jgi:hypothetical protein
MSPCLQRRPRAGECDGGGDGDGGGGGGSHPASDQVALGGEEEGGRRGDGGAGGRGWGGAVLEPLGLMRESSAYSEQ